MSRQTKPAKTARIRDKNLTDQLDFERLERRELLAVAPPSSELTEGNAAEWEAFADGASATVTNNSTFVKQGGQSIKLDTLGGFDTGVRYRAPASNWDFSQIDVVTFWVYGNNTTFGWQGNQPVIKFLSPGGSLTLTPNEQMMPNFSWAQLTIPLAGNGVWQRATQGNFDIGNVTTFEIHQDTWDYGFISYYDGVRFARYMDLPNLFEPKGLAVDSQSRTYVVESAAGQIRVFDTAGQVVQAIGSSGNGDGKLSSPTDVAIGPGNKLYVSDTGNHRIQVFETTGSFLMKFGTPGSGIGAFSNPAGIAVDGTSGKVYVADEGNHRVQRFLPSGAIDSSWGTGGVVGSTGTVRRDHAGFDSPSDVAIHPNGEIYIADRGNQRIEVYSSGGQYLRTYLGVFQARSLSFDSLGNLYIAGDDPNNNYHAFDGRLRVLGQGDELIGKHYTGGLDDLGRRLNGVVVRPDGRIVISDAVNGRLVQVDSGLNAPLGNVAVKAAGGSLVITWDSLQPGASRVMVNGQIYTNPGSTRNHAVRIEGLAPNTRVGYSLAFSDTFTGQERWTPEDYVNTGAIVGQTDFLRVKAVGLVYTDGNNSSGYTRLPQDQIDLMRNRFDTVAAYYWRNSGMKLWLDFTVREVNVDLNNGANLFSRMGSDLASLGFSAADDFDAVYSVWPWASGNFGGSSSVFGRSVAAAIWATQTDFVAIHEVNHSMDSLYGMSGLKKYEFNHGIWAVPNGLGHDFAINAQILRNMLGANYPATLAPFTKRFSAADADGDGFPDSSPAGLSRPLAITEATFGSSPGNVDTDGDGWSDLTEATALTNTATNGTLADSDNDGLRDSIDPNPLYRIANLIRKGTPLIDGSIGVAEGWTPLTQNWGFTNTSLVSDNNQLQSQVTTYAAWDDSYLYFALLGPASQTQLRIDGDADNWFMGSSNYELNLRNDSSSLNLRVNAGIPDLFRQIDNDGQYSEFLDTDPQFTRPYNGRPIFNQPSEGLGFTGRLVTESQLTYQRGGSGNQRVWEVRIPWSNRSLLRGQAGKEVAVDFNVNGDRLFETDHFARLRLVTQAVEAPVMTLGGNFTHIEKAAPILIAQQGSIVDYDSFDLQNGQLTVSIATADSSDRLAILNDGVERGQIGIAGSSVLYGGRVIGSFTGGTGPTPLVVTLNQNATVQAAEALLRRISYQASGNDPALGTRTVSFVLSDGDGGVSAARTVVVAVQGVNDLPTLNALSNLEVEEDSGQQTVNLSGISAGGGESQPLRVIAISSNNALIANPAVNYVSPNDFGAITFSPLPNQSGLATITVTVEDGGLDRNLSTVGDNATISRSFTVNVTAVNDLPTLNPLSNLTINQDAPQQTVSLIGIGAGGGESQPLRVTASSDSPGLIPHPAIDYTSPNQLGSLTFIPAIGQFGVATITVMVEDGGFDQNLNTITDNASISRSFIVTVVPDPGISVSSPVGPIGEQNSGSQPVYFTISLSSASTKTVAVDYATTSAGYSNPATSGNDYLPVTGRVEFAPGETSKSIAVSIRGDRLVEMDELFGLMLSNAANGRLEDSLADVAITDDDSWAYPQEVDFGTEVSPLKTGAAGVGVLPYSGSKGLGWTSGIENVLVVDRGVGVPALRDLALTRDSSFGFAVPNGQYFVRITFGDATQAHDQMRVFVEGAAKPLVNTGVNQFVTRAYVVDVTDGRLDLRFLDVGGTDPNVAIAGIGFSRR